MELKEKLEEYGTSEMAIYTDGEILSMLLGIEPEGASLSDVMRDARSVKGIGKRKAAVVDALREAVFRIGKAGRSRADAIRGPEDAADYVFRHARLRYEDREHFCILGLNVKNCVIGFEVISIGSATATITHPREIFRAAIRMKAVAIILVHNHPSGDVAPSREDVQVTKRMADSGKILDIPVLDHIIVGDGNFASLKEKGCLS
jgi:DNA repair protein RadC